MNKKTKKILQVATLIGLFAVLTACGTGPVTSESTGIWDRYIIYNLSRIILWISKLFGGNYAWGIIGLTAIVRVLLIPLTKKQFESQRKMWDLQPELDKIQEKYPGKDRESLELMQMEQMQLMEDNGVSQTVTLVLQFIQLPIMIALYQAVTRTKELQSGTFLWTNLGQKDPYYILPILSALLTLYNTYLTMKANPTQQAGSKVSMYTMPALILLITINLPAAVNLYYVVSNLIAVITTLIFNNPYKIIAEREAEAEKEKEQQKKLRRAIKKAKGR